MTTQETLEYNKRCAEFLKPNNNILSNIYYFPQFGTYTSKYGQIEYEEAFMIEEMKFHSDWNWIMEIVEAINKTQNPRQGGDTTHSTLKREVQALLGKTAKEAVVQAINQFLIWYNKSKTT